MEKKTKIQNKFVNESIVRKFLISDSDSECDSISHDSPPLSDTEISNSIGTPSTVICNDTETPSTNRTGMPTIAISDSTGTPDTATPTMPGSLVDSQTPGSSITSQLAGHTPVLPKEANSKHIKHNAVVASEVTLDTVHKSLSKMIESVLERMDNTEKRINSLEQKIISTPEPKKNKSKPIIDKAVRVSIAIAIYYIHIYMYIVCRLKLE